MKLQRRRRSVFTTYVLAVTAAAAWTLLAGHSALAQEGPVGADKSTVTPAVLATDAALTRPAPAGAFATVISGMVDVHLPPPTEQLRGLVPPTSAKGPAPKAPANPGIIIFEPGIAPGTDAQTAAFAAGCGEWLQFEVGGLPQMGQTPSFDSVARARREAGFTVDRRLNVYDARVVAALTGATDVAVGRVDARGTARTLSYTIYDAATGRPVGAPITAAGDLEALRTALPRIATEIAGRLGVSVIAGIPPPDLNVTEFASLGRLETSYSPSAADLDNISAASGRSAVAALAVLENRGTSCFSDATRLTDLLLTKLAPTNGLAWDRVSFYSSILMVPYGAQLDALRHAFPNTLTLATSDRWRQFASGTPAGERWAAEDAVRIAPRNPDAWCSLGRAYSDDNERIRYGRTWENIDTNESQRLIAVYERWEQAYLEATRLDRIHAFAWTDLAIAAEFAGDDSLANRAIRTAEHVSPFGCFVYKWELQMFQNKWDGRRSDLDAAAIRAASANYKDIESASQVATDLMATGYGALAKQLMTRYLAAANYRLTQSPEDWHAHWNRAVMLGGLGRHQESLQEFELISRLRPTDGGPVFQMGSQYDAMGDAETPAASYRRVLQIDPAYPGAAAYLGSNDVALHRDADAIQWLQVAVHQSPNLGYALYDLGRAYSDSDPPRPADSAAAIQKAIDLGYGGPVQIAYLAYELSLCGRTPEAVPLAERAYAMDSGETGASAIGIGSRLTFIYDQARRYRDAVRIGEDTLRIRPGDVMTNLALGDAYANLGRGDDAVKAWETVLQSGSTRGMQQANALMAKYAILTAS